MSSPLTHATVRTVAELRAVIADYPDDLAVQTDTSLVVVVQHWPALPGAIAWAPLPERLELVPDYIAA